MMRKEFKIITGLLLIASFIGAGNTCNSQIIQKDSILASDTILTEIEVGEDEMDFYTSRLDSFDNSVDIKNAFSYDSMEVHFLPSFPRDIPDSIYIQRLQKAEQVIDLSYNPAVLGFIKMYTERKRDQVERIIKIPSDYRIGTRPPCSFVCRCHGSVAVYVRYCQNVEYGDYEFY